MYPHRIRLRGPWEGGPVGETPRRVTVPCNLADWNWTAAPVRLMRKFGYPGRIDAHERVWLTVEGLSGRGAITLNGKALGEAVDSPFERDVTSLLLPHNQLEVTMQGSRLGEVAMEVRATAFLQGVKVCRRQGILDVSGLVAGTCDRPLELYILVDRRNAWYQTIGAGESFKAELPEQGQSVRVELINVSTVGYAVEID
jgi:hypothetical protein